FFDNLRLDGTREVIPDFVRTERAVQQKGGGRRSGRQHIETLEEIELVASDEIRRLDQVRCVDRLRTEAQVRDGHRARLLRVIDEVALGVQVRLGADDLDRVL